MPAQFFYQLLLNQIVQGNFKIAQISKKRPTKCVCKLFVLNKGSSEENTFSL